MVLSTPPNTSNAAGRMVRAENVTSTLVYTYNAAGLRVAQSVESSQSVFSWDWASGLPEMLTQSPNPQSPNHQSLFLVGHETLARWDGATWAYHLPDALGSVRQEADGAGAVVSAREWTPYGVEVGAAQAGLGYTGEWWDADVGLEYLRARWYEPQTSIFLSRDLVRHNHPYQYAQANPVNSIDPSGLFSLSPEPIHAMIQAKYIETWGLGYQMVIPEYPIRGGSKHGLTTATEGEFGQPDFKAWLEGTPTGYFGYADIVGLVTPSWGHIYEIKHKRDIIRGIAEITWYIQVNNSDSLQPRLSPGTGYTWSPNEELIGTNPYYAGQEIVASMQAPGVITYRGKPKPKRELGPRPVHVWEWDPETRKVVKRQLVPVYAYACYPGTASLSGKEIGNVVIIGGTAFTIWAGIQVGQAVVGFVLAGPPGAVVFAAAPP